MKATKFVGRGMDPPSPLRIAHSGRDVHGERSSHSSVRRGRGKPRSPGGLPAGSGRDPRGILNEVRGEDTGRSRVADCSKIPSAKGGRSIRKSESAERGNVPAAVELTG